MTGEEQQYSPAAEPVGEQLRRAREKSGLSVSAIADQQHLRVSIIQAIEAGDYSKIDTELFLKGYVRGYARQVGLDPDAVIRDLDAELEPRRKEREHALQANPLVTIERRRNQKRRIAKGILLVLVLLGVAFLAMTYFNGSEKAATGNSEAEASRQEAESAASAGADASEPAGDGSGEQEGSAGPDPEQMPGQEVPSVPTEVSPEASDDAPLPEETGVAPDVTENGAPAVEPEESASLQSQPPVVDESSPAAPADTMPQVVQEPVSGLSEAAVTGVTADDSGRLQMTFSADCWIQVTDANGNRLASGLRGQGDQLDVAGDPPLRVVVGAMSAVESVRFQGESLDTGDFRVVNNRSEFTLEP